MSELIEWLSKNAGTALACAAAIIGLVSAVAESISAREARRELALLRRQDAAGDANWHFNLLTSSIEQGEADAVAWLRLTMQNRSQQANTIVKAELRIDYRQDGASQDFHLYLSSASDSLAGQVVDVFQFPLHLPSRAARTGSIQFLIPSGVLGDAQVLRYVLVLTDIDEDLFFLTSILPTETLRVNDDT